MRSVSVLRKYWYRGQTAQFHSLSNIHQRFLITSMQLQWLVRYLIAFITSPTLATVHAGLILNLVIGHKAFRHGAIPVLAVHRFLSMIIIQTDLGGLIWTIHRCFAASRRKLTVRITLDSELLFAVCFLKPTAPHHLLGWLTVVAINVPESLQCRWDADISQFELAHNECACCIRCHVFWKYARGFPNCVRVITPVRSSV